YKIRFGKKSPRRFRHEPIIRVVLPIPTGSQPLRKKLRGAAQPVAQIASKWSKKYSKAAHKT
ncbi:hypothetical protein, partial [Pseudomonas mediterranea]|uniref:hypothetical protein n=1 Tax=Pseudomonas mediterranea TaxID=183795 RepID=UPI0019D404F9